MKLPPRSLAAACLCAALLLPNAASAADPAAEAVFDEGLKAFEAGDYATACPKLETAVKLTKGEGLGGTLLLAECWERQGRTASAWGLYRTVAARAAAQKQDERRAKAEAGEQRMAALLHRVEIVVAPDVAAIAGVEIRRGEELVPREAWGVALPVDPGAVVVRATAPGRTPFERTVEVPATSGATKIPIDTMAPAAAGAAPTKPADPAPPATPPPPQERSGGGLGGLGIAGLVIGGTGVLAMGGSVILAAVAKGQWSDAAAACPNAVCSDAADVEAVDDARSLAGVGTAVFIGGAVLAAAGGTMLVIDLASGDAPTARSPRRVRVGVGGGGLVATGSF
jgi:hypothetical protein